MKTYISIPPLRRALAAVVLSATLLSAPSCVRQDPERCPDPRGNVHLTVSVTTAIDLTRARIDGFEIDSAHLYVFDADGGYVTSSESGESGESGREYDFWLTLPAGDFDFVVWTNMGGHYRVHQAVEELESDGLAMRDLELFLDHGGRPITDTIPHLLHGITRGHTIVDNADNRVEVEITPKTYTVNLKALNLPSGDDDYTFTITDNNSHYDFEGELIEDKPHFTHTRTDGAPEGEFNASIRTLALSAERHPRFQFTNATTGSVMHDADLIYTITRAYRAASRAVDFSSTYVYDIVLSFDATKMEFTISVNGWEHDQRYEILD